MAPCLSKFPSLCLEAIFKHVPLGDLLRSVGLVCTNWNKSRLTELMRRRRLVIVEVEEQLDTLNCDLIFGHYETDLIQHVRRDDGSPWFTLGSLEQIKFDALTIPDCIFDITSALLPNITYLTLVFHEHLSNNALTRMILFIDHYSQHLVDLKLCLDNLQFRGTDSAVEFVNNLFSCLNHLQSLRHLKLDLSLYQYPQLRIRPQLTFLSRLTTFSVHVYGIEDPIGWILFSLRQYGRNIDSIELYNNVKLPNLLSLDHQLESKFNVVYCLNGIGIDDYDDTKRFCSRFSSLTSLSLFEFSMPMTMLARCLSLLPQLVKLDLHFSFLPLVEAQPDGEQPQPMIAQVPSVRLLILDIKTGSHLDSEKLFIPEIFPNLQVLRLSHHCIRCPVCEIMQLTPPQMVQAPKPELVRKVAECSRLTRQTFRRCTNLHTVALVGSDDNDTLINVNEL